MCGDGCTTQLQYIGAYVHMYIFGLQQYRRGSIVTLLISGEVIVRKYVAESITMIAGRFDHKGLCQLRTKQ